VTGYGRSFNYMLTEDLSTIGRSKNHHLVLLDQTASRLEKMARPDQIFIGEATYDAVKASFHIQKVGMKPVKGNTRAVTVYEVLDD
jgi:hypothetical protein